MIVNELAAPQGSTFGVFQLPATVLHVQVQITFARQRDKGLILCGLIRDEIEFSP